MNVHILVAISADEKTSVEVFSSRKKMTDAKFGVKGKKCYMFPPVSADRSVEGILKIAKLVDDIHTKGPVAVLETLENADD